MQDAQVGGRRAARHEVATPVTRPRRSTAERARPRRRSLTAAATLSVLGLLAGLALAPLPQPGGLLPFAAADAPHLGDVQDLEVASDVSAPTVSHESYVATTGAQTLVAGGTNVDWAKLVLVEGEWPLTEENVTFMMRWMRQENGADNWWNRNNPLNNGQGSGGGSGLGSYPTLIEAAYYAAENLQSGRYPEVDAALASGDSADATAQAIWASAWASSHYGYGTHWSSRPYEVIEAPASAWGR
ncbi:hypothetical protein BJY17_002352 [Agromyces hippuratus]|uniref:Uncharacterized protein n=1 Tax=Agromyces hippuratus TaxID=286438 RepID=A0A852X6N6_9MICO|nr:hypothetical protein [Agromyces hippuratus]NYG21605.1 hypothetical protein [Agromyces hippuratus]